MKWHVLRPLWVAIGVIAAIFVAQVFLVPNDFGVHGDSFTYNYYRLSNIQEWKEFPVKYQGRDSCVECHRDNVRTVRRSPHRRLECENCHGPAVDHPDNVEYLPSDISRDHCLRCHAFLDYPNSPRAEVPTVNNRMHYARRECVECHNPHDPTEDVE